MISKHGHGHRPRRECRCKRLRENEAKVKQLEELLKQARMALRDVPLLNGYVHGSPTFEGIVGNTKNALAEIDKVIAPE